MDNIWNGVVTPATGNSANSNIRLFPLADQPTQTESTPKHRLRDDSCRGELEGI